MAAEVYELGETERGEISEALGAPTRLTFAGRIWTVHPLDFNDLCVIEERLGDVGRLDLNRLTHQRLVLFLAIRKADPDVTAADRLAGQYRMSEAQVGQMITVQQLQKPETVQFLADVLRLSGMAGEAGNSGEATAAAPKNPKALKGRA